MRTFKGFLKGDINNIARADIGEQILLASNGFLLLLLFDNCPHIVLERTGLIEGWDELGIYYVGVVPLRLSRLAMFAVELLPRNPFVVVGGFIKGRPTRSVPNDVVLC